jgi:predicted enzyme related to lactoylglutathione lyase
MKVIRIVPNVVSEAFGPTRQFYAALFDLEVSIELDGWYLQLAEASNPQLNVGFLQPGSEFTAGRDRSTRPSGLVVTFQVDDVDEAYERARAMGAEIVVDIRDEPYGQRRFVVVDPNGSLLNVMSPR